MFLLPLLLLPGLLRAQESGMAIVGGNSYQYDDPYTNITAEFWSPAPGDVYCTLPSLIRPGPRDMFAPTLDLWQDKLIVCGGASCDQLTPSGWRHWRHTRHFRDSHTSAITSKGLLLVGGYDSDSTTEFIPWDGGESIEGFEPGYLTGWSYHCSITTSPDTIVLTGGYASTSASTLAVEYSNVASDVPWEINNRDLPPLLHARYSHACGSYSVGNTQMLLVTGGLGTPFALATTEVFAYNGDGAGSWREAGPVPDSGFGRYGLRAGLVNGIIHIVGGTEDSSVPMNDIVSWDSVTETWTYVGRVGRFGRVYPGVTGVPMSVVADFC